MWSNHEQSIFIGCDADYNDASVVLFGAPYDSTTSNRPGARFGPPAIRRESWGLETFSPYQDRDLCDIAVCDVGDIELPFGDNARALTMIEQDAAAILSDGKTPFLLGGEHLVTLGAVRAAAAQHKNLHIIHLDAHADLRDDYLGVELSHACVMRRCHELVGDGRIHQFGIRSGDRDEFTWAEQHVDMQRFTLDGMAELPANLADAPVYLTIDLDVLDPSLFPGTGTPEAGGVSFTQLLDALCAMVPQLNIVGCDVVELSPHYDPSGASTATACKVVRELLLMLP